MLEGWPKPKLNKHFWKTNHGQTLESVVAGGGVGMRVRCVHVCSVVSDFLWSYGLEPSRLLCPWDSPGKKNWSGLQFPTPEDLPDPRDQTCVSCMVGRFFTIEPRGKPMEGNRDEMPSDTVPTRMMLRLRSSQGYTGPWRTPDWQAPSVRWSGAFFLETYLAWTGSRRITVASFAQYGTKLLKDHSIVSISGYKCYLLKPLQEKDFTSMSSIHKYSQLSYLIWHAYKQSHWNPLLLDFKTCLYKENEKISREEQWWNLVIICRNQTSLKNRHNNN